MSESALKAELTARAQRARETHAKLILKGQLGVGYHPEQEQIDCDNADWLAGVLEAQGWPKRSVVGDEGAAAAVELLRRAMSRPSVVRRGVALMMEAAQANEASLIDAAHFADRIAVFEGKGQLFATQLDWGPDGLAPAPIQEPDHVDARRATVGLPPLADVLEDARAFSTGGPPPDLQQRRAAFEHWAKSVGWRTS